MFASLVVCMGVNREGGVPPGFSYMISLMCFSQQALILWKYPNSHQPS